MTTRNSVATSPVANSFIESVMYGSADNRLKHSIDEAIDRLGNVNSDDDIEYIVSTLQMARLAFDKRDAKLPRESHFEYDALKLRANCEFIESTEAAILFVNSATITDAREWSRGTYLLTAEAPSFEKFDAYEEMGHE